MHSKFILVFNVEQEHAHFFLTRIRFNYQWIFPSISMKVISSINKDFLNIDVRPYVVENLATWYSNHALPTVLTGLLPQKSMQTYLLLCSKA